MPYSAPRECSYPGCRAASPGRFCDKHKRTDRQRHDRERGSAASRGYDSRWRKAREGFLRKHPTCAHCELEGRVVPATIVDHNEPHRGNRKLFWDRTNWQPLCKMHHDRKTAREDGGFGR